MLSFTASDEKFNDSLKLSAVVVNMLHSPPYATYLAGHAEPYGLQ